MYLFSFSLHVKRISQVTVTHIFHSREINNQNKEHQQHQVSKNSSSPPTQKLYTQNRKKIKIKIKSLIRHPRGSLISLLRTRPLQQRRPTLQFLLMLHERAARAAERPHTVPASGPLKPESLSDLAALHHQWDEVEAAVSEKEVNAALYYIISISIKLVVIGGRMGLAV